MLTVAIFRDGPFLPPMEGGSESLLGLAEDMTKYATVFLFRCYRGWDDYKIYQKKHFNTIFIKPKDYYSNRNLYSRLIKEFKVDVCHFDNAEAACLQSGLIKKNILKVWEVMNVNHILFDRMGKDDRAINNAKKYELEASILADLVLCRSLKDSNDLASIGVDSSKIQQYRGCINPENFIFKANRIEQKKILFLGNMYYGPNENAVKLIQDKIVPEVINQEPSSRFIFVGKYPPYLKIRARNYGDQVQFMGGVADLNPILSTVGVAICPLFEGSGTRLKLLTYLSAGIPTITSNIGIEGLNKEISKHVIIEEKIKNYPDLILKVLSQSLPQKRLKKARKWIEDNYSWANESKKIVKLYKNALLIKNK